MKCNFKADNEDLLKVHNIRKHTDKATLKYPNNCHICEYEWKNCKEIRIHMDIHALEITIFGDFQCKDCRFIGDSIETMEVHIGKCLPDELFNGLCEWKSDNLENLKTHLTSCEVYECQQCDKRFLALTDIKLHIKEEHEEE